MLSSTLIVFLTLLVSVDVAVILAILLVLFLHRRKKKIISSEIDELDKKLEQIQRSTKTTFAPMIPWHEKLREKFRWYYSWHLNPFATRIHLATLSMYFVAVLFGVVYGIWQQPTYQTKADGLAEPYMVKDINTEGDSFPSDFISIGDTLYFLAEDQTYGIELWRSDGTADGTSMVKDITAGTADSDLNNFTVSNNLLYFFRNYSLWRSDGTADGTYVVKDLGSYFEKPQYLVSDGNTLYFVFYGSEVGRELWRSDGTADGTYMVKDILPGNTGSNPSNLMVVGNTLYFSASDGQNGSELWRSDGTADGTLMIKDILSGEYGSGPSKPVAIGNIIYFSADSTWYGSDSELWRSDGTAEGTYMIKEDIYPGESNCSIENLTVAGSKVYYTARDYLHGLELWRSDGTTEGTYLVKDIEYETSSSNPANLTAVGDILYFSADQYPNGIELWRSDGTTDGTNIVGNISLKGSSNPNNLTAVGNILYFRASDDTELGLWRSDGTADGTYKIIKLGINGDHQHIRPVGDKIYFVANDGINGLELWSVGSNYVPSETNPIFNRQFSSGNGFPASPFMITSCSDLELIGEIGVNNEYYFKLANDIDCISTSISDPEDSNYVDYLYNSGAGFPPIGTEDNPFRGHFNGDGFTISNLTINRPGIENVGLFGFVDSYYHSLTFYNFNIIDFSVVGGKNTGAIIGRGENNFGSNWITLQVINIDGDITSVTGDSRSYAGSMVGWGGFVAILSCHSTATVNSEDYSGGLIGYVGVEAEWDMSNLYIYDSSFEGFLNTRDISGGLAGYVKVHSIYSIEATYENRETNTIIERSFMNGDMDADGDAFVGGLVGVLERGDSIVPVVIRDSYSQSDLGSCAGCGGLIGKLGIDMTVENVYSTGLISGQAEYSGGLIGINEGSTVMNSFYDQETSQQSDNTGKGVPKTTAEMKNITTFQDALWNIALYNDRTDEIWRINNGVDYPVLSPLTVEVEDPFVIDYVDATPPTFFATPNSDSIINLEEGQTITTNPYIIIVNPYDDSGIQKVLFYVDDVLICTQNSPNYIYKQFAYSCSWDTSLYHSTIKVYAYDGFNNVSEPIIRNVNVDPSLYGGVDEKSTPALPKKNTTDNIVLEESDDTIQEPEEIDIPIQIEQPPVIQEKKETVAQSLLNTSYVALATVATASAITAGATSSFPFVALLFNYWNYLGALFAVRKNKRFGSVFDSVTQKPISGVPVSLFNAKYNQLVETKITDQKGRFVINAVPGEYYLMVKKNDYIFPSKYGSYGYTGNRFKIESGETIILKDIPLDPKIIKFRKKNQFIGVFKRILNLSYLPILIIGTLFCLYAVMRIQNTMSYVNLSLYLLIWIYMLLAKKIKKRTGKVYDPKRKKPISNAIIRLFDAKTNKLLETKISNIKGNFNMLLVHGNYYVQVTGEGYQSQSREVTIDKDTYFTSNFYLVRA